jgi:sulfofructosephosphate aldolase
MTSTLDALARPSGGFAMVAMDQRGSLRDMLAAHPGRASDDAALVEFKLAVARELGPLASGFLIDREYGFAQVAAERSLPDSCGLILAVDALQQRPGGPVEETGLDPAVDPAAARAAGAVALKLLLIWRDDARRADRLALAERFVATCRRAGLLSVLEGVARPATDAAILAAAAELGALRPSLYKAQVPGLGEHDDRTASRVCEEITKTVPVPWVVLSQGVPLERFTHAVEVAARAGASGFLAGRAVWSATPAAADPVPALRDRSVPRLRELTAVVDRYARPWREAGG